MAGPTLSATSASSGGLPLPTDGGTGVKKHINAEEEIERNIHLIKFVLYHATRDLVEKQQIPETSLTDRAISSKKKMSATFCIGITLLSYTIFLTGLFLNRYLGKHTEWFALAGGIGSYVGTLVYTLNQFRDAKKVKRQKNQGQKSTRQVIHPKLQLLLTPIASTLMILGILISKKRLLPQTSLFTSQITLYGGITTLGTRILSFLYGKHVDRAKVNLERNAKKKIHFGVNLILVALTAMLAFGLAGRYTNFIFNRPPSEFMRNVISFCFYTGAYGLGTSAAAMGIMGLFILLRQYLNIKGMRLFKIEGMQHKRDALHAQVVDRMNHYEGDRLRKMEEKLRKIDQTEQVGWWSLECEMRLSQQISELSLLESSVRNAERNLEEASKMPPAAAIVDDGGPDADSEEPTYV